MRLPIAKQPLLELAKQTSQTEAVRQAISNGVIDFFLEAWICYASTELKANNMLDGVSPVGGLDLGRKIFENIQDDFIEEFDKFTKKEKN